MAYTVSNTDGSRTITVADGTLDTTTYSVTLIGKNVTNYGDVFVKNSIRHLENFASAPTWCSSCVCVFSWASVV